MASNKKLYKIYTDIMGRLYKEAEPSLDWDALIASEDAVKKSFNYLDHYLDQDRFDEIVKEELGKYKLSKREVTSLNFEVYLGASPVSVKKEELKI